MKKIKKIFTLLLLTGLVFSCSSDDDPEPVQPPVQSTEANILTFTLTDQTDPATINASAATVEIEVENGTDLSSLSPSFTVSAGASASPASGTSGDYSSQVTITVTAEDGTTTKAWSVDVSEATADVESSDTDILTFSLPEETGDATIDDTAHTIAIEVANGTDLTMLTPTFTISDGATADPASGTQGDYSSDVTITVTAEDGTTMQDWTVNVTEEAAMASSDTDILTFSLPEETGGEIIDYIAHTIAIEVANGTDLTMLTPTFTISDGATADPASGTQGDYSSEVTITVTAEDGTTMQDWAVNVTEASGGGGTTTVEFGDGGVKATAIRNLVVDGVTYDVEFRFVYPQQIYGNYPGTYTFKTNDDAITATEAINAALNNTDAATVGEEGLVTDEGRYRIGYLSFETGPVENTRFKTGVFEPASWRTGLEETNPYNSEPVTFAAFTQL